MSWDKDVAEESKKFAILYNSIRQYEKDPEKMFWLLKEMQDTLNMLGVHIWDEMSRLEQEIRKNYKP
jgi:hypothetical protein